MVNDQTPAPPGLPWEAIVAALVRRALRGTWETRTMKQKIDGIEYYKQVVVPTAASPELDLLVVTRARADEERALRLLYAALLNLGGHARDVPFVGHLVDDTNAWRQDTVWVPTLWHGRNGQRPPLCPASPAAAAAAALGRIDAGYLVTWVPEGEGAVCSCPYGQHTQDEQTGASRFCSHAAIAELARLEYYGTVPDADRPLVLKGADYVHVLLG